MEVDGRDHVPARDPGDDFEQTCWSLLRRRYEQLRFIPAETGGCRIEGFATDHIAYGLVERVPELAPTGVDFAFDAVGRGGVWDVISVTGDLARVATIRTSVRPWV